MDTLILKLIMDISFYLAVCMPMVLRTSGAVKAVLLAIPVCWAVWLFMNWKKRNLVEMVRYNFFMEMRILIFFEIFEVLFLKVPAWRSQCVPFITAFVISGVLLMRSGRLAAGSQGKESFWKANGGELLLVLGGAFVLSRESVSQGFLGILGALYNALIFPVIRFFLEILIRILIWLGPYLGKIFPKLSYEMPDVQLAMDGTMEELFGKTETREPPAYLKFIGIGILIFIVIMFFRYLYRRLSERGSSRSGQIAGEIRRSPAGMAEKKRPGWNFGGERNVRYYYRRFLSICAMWGIEVDKNAATTREIGKNASGLWGMDSELSELRDIYLRIRYGEKKESREERRRAKEIVKAVKEKTDSVRT